MRQRLIFKAAPLIVAVLVCARAPAAITATGEVSPLPIVPNTAIQVANQGIGMLVIDAGSTLVAQFLEVAQAPTGIGTAIIRDPGSLWRFMGGEIGTRGVGRLEVRNGATVEVPQGANSLRVGPNISANGTIVVDGQGSVLQVIAPFTISQLGSALVRVSNGGIVNVPEDTTVVGAGGRIELDGGLMRTNQFQNGGIVTGNGELAVVGSTTFISQGRIEVGPGDRLLVSGASGSAMTNNGTLAVDDGELDLRRFVTNIDAYLTTARITLQDGIIRFPITGTTQSSLQNNSLVAALGGENHVYGRVSNASVGEIVATNKSTLFFHHDVTSEGTITVATGSKVIFLEDLINSGTLLADLAGAEGFGHAEVYGTAQLEGASLEVGLSSGFVPEAGDSFVLISAAGGITGVPMLAATNPSNSLEWDLDVDPNQVTVSAMPALEGDYNANGVVDTADYVVWRKLLDESGPALLADGDDNNVVNDADYQIWRNNFGATSGSPAAGAAAVPEPAAAWFVCFGAAAISLNRKWKLHYCSRPL